tara:strand:- start:306 stop:662 length:357 start_codon:yes stop_codon:yes gene_type:complete
METKIRDHVDAQYDNLTGLTIESVHVKDEFVLMLLSGDKFTTIEATCDDDEAYIQTYEQHSDKWLLLEGFSIEFLRDNRLVTEKAIEGIEKENQARQARRLADERQEYEKLKAKFESD